MSDKKKGVPIKRAPATTLEAREKQLVSLAVDLVEKQLLDGTATSQVITHYLKLGTRQAEIEKEILTERRKLLTAQTDQIASGKRVEELYKNALDAMRTYSGNREDEDYEED